MDVLSIMYYVRPHLEIADSVIVTSGSSPSRLVPVCYSFGPVARSAPYFERSRGGGPPRVRDSFFFIITSLRQFFVSE